MGSQNDVALFKRFQHWIERVEDGNIRVEVNDCVIGRHLQRLVQKWPLYSCAGFNDVVFEDPLGKLWNTYFGGVDKFVEGLVAGIESHPFGQFIDDQSNKMPIWMTPTQRAEKHTCAV